MKDSYEVYHSEPRKNTAKSMPDALAIKSLHIGGLSANSIADFPVVCGIPTNRVRIRTFPDPESSSIDIFKISYFMDIGWISIFFFGPFVK